MSDVFIIGSSEDFQRVAYIADRLKKEGWSVYWYPTIQIGRAFDESLEKEFKTTKVIIVLWSKNSIKSAWVRGVALEGMHRKILATAFIENVEIPFGYQLIQSADLTEYKYDESDTEGMKLLIKTVASIGNLEMRHELESKRIASATTEFERRQVEEQIAKEQTLLLRKIEEERFIKQKTDLDRKEEQERIDKGESPKLKKINEIKWHKKDYGYETLGRQSGSIEKKYDIDDIIYDVGKKLKDGYLDFKYPKQMLLGKKEIVSADIFYDKAILNGISDRKNVEEIKVGKTLSVKLIGNDFEIFAKNSEYQLILPHEKTYWQWEVKPIKSGVKVLELIVIVRVEIEGKDEVHDFPVLSKEVFVRINRLFILRMFWKKNWQWIISTIGGSGVLVIILKALGILK